MSRLNRLEDSLNQCELIFEKSQTSNELLPQTLEILKNAIQANYELTSNKSLLRRFENLTNHKNTISQVNSIDLETIPKEHQNNLIKNIKMSHENWLIDFDIYRKQCRQMIFEQNGKDYLKYLINRLRESLDMKQVISKEYLKRLIFLAKNDDKLLKFILSIIKEQR